MEIKRPYKGISIIGFSDGVTRTDNGVIFDVYYAFGDNPVAMGRIGKWEDGYFNGPAFTATPTGYSPFVNRARTFNTRKEAAIWLLGVYESKLNWMAEHIANPRPGSTHIPLSAE